MSAARLYTSAAPSQTRRQLASSLKSRHRLSTPGTRWYHCGRGFLSTARMRVKPRSWKYLASAPAMKPPAPPITIRSFLVINSPCIGQSQVFAPQDLRITRVGFKTMSSTKRRLLAGAPIWAAR